jgi:hypothetical protein
VRRGPWLLIALVAMLTPAAARAQEPAADGAAPPRWSGAAELALYIIPEEENYLWPSLSVDRDWLHLGVRYNYEDRNTASFWVGANFEWGEKVSVAVTPMFGVVTGDTDGVAPGFLFTLSTWKIELYSEGEWVLDAGEKTDSFYYSWSELTLSPTDWFYVGLAAQKTRAYETARYIERGFLTGLAWRNASLTGYVFEPFSDQPTVVVSVGVEF